MSNKRNLSQQSIDQVLKLSINLRKELLEQFKSFEASKNEYLINEFEKLLDFKRIKNENLIYFKINTDQILKIIDLLLKLDAFNQFKDSFNNLAPELDELKKEIIAELIMLPTQLCQEFEINKDINPNNDQFYANGNNESTNDEEKNKSIDFTKTVDDMWPIIFKYLSIKDLFNCRLVSKSIKNFSDHTNGINKLVIGQPEFANYCYYNYKQIEDKDIISLKCFRTILKLSIFNLDTNLKYLKVYDQQFKLEELSNLINLESIEFGRYCRNDNQQILNLNNLKVFASKDYSVHLNTPKLEKIEFLNINKIKSNNPESIKHLITQNYDNKLEIFKNLEIMELRNTNQPVDENLLSLFKNLKQLKINLNLNEVDYSNEIIKNSLIKILNDKMKLNRVIDVYLEGIKIENINKFNELVPNGYSDWEFKCNNYDLLDLNLSFINELYYDELEVNFNNIKNDLPSSFFDKFFNINKVSVFSVKDVNGFDWFLNNLKCLIRLEIGFDVSLDEVFYNNLPNTIRELSIYNRKDINYDFILKLSKLIGFGTLVDKDLFDLAFKSFLNLKYLERFIFTYKNKIILIEKKDNKYFYLNNKSKKLDYNQLIEECNKIRSK